MEAPGQALVVGAVEAHPNLEYQKNFKSDKIYVEAPWL